MIKRSVPSWTPISLVVLMAVLIVTVPASGASPSTTNTYEDDPDAVALLLRATSADDRVSYTGTQYVSAWSPLAAAAAATSAVMRIRHSAGGSTEVWSHDESEPVLWDEPGPASHAWLAGTNDSVNLIESAYRLQLGEPERVAGRLTDVVDAVRADGSVAARLWLDRETALTLRRETFKPDGSMLNASAYVALNVTDAMACCGGSSQTLSGTTVARAELADFRAAGWLCPEVVHGGFALYNAQRVDDVLHVSYSDGVMTASVFQQKGRLDVNDMDGYSTRQFAGGTVFIQPGPPASFTWSSAGRVFTAVSDGPVAVIEAIVAAAPPDELVPADEDGFAQRLARGAQRVGSWLNPFD